LGPYYQHSLEADMLYAMDQRCLNQNCSDSTILPREFLFDEKELHHEDETHSTLKMAFWHPAGIPPDYLLHLHEQAISQLSK